MASLAPMPVLGALDNLAAQRSATHLIDWVNEHGARKYPKHFELLKNGDLLQMLHVTLLARGPNTIKMIKVKGHDTLTEGVVDEARRIAAYGNQQSDELAKRARRDFAPAHILRLADYLVWRHQKYTEVIKAMHNIIVRTHIWAHELRARPAFILAHPLADRRRQRMVAFRSPTFPKLGDHDAEPFLVSCTASQDTITKMLGKVSGYAQGAWQLLTRCQIVRATVQKPGLTWLEMLAISTAWSPCSDLRRRQEKATAAKGVAGILATFKKEMLHIFQVAIHPTQHCLLHVAHGGENRLGGIGHLNRLPHLGFLPVLHEQIQKQLGIVLLNTTQAAPARITKAIQRGQAVMLKAKTFTGHGSLKWHNQIEELHTILLARHGDALVHPYIPSAPSSSAPAAVATARHSNPTEPPGIQIHFTCECGHPRLATTPAFDPLKPTKFTWCNGCKRYVAGRKWLCSCRVTWSTCAHHTSLLSPKALPNRSKRRAPDRPMTDAEAQRSLARLRPTPTASRLILTPGLARRFPHLT